MRSDYGGAKGKVGEKDGKGSQLSATMSFVGIPRVVAGRSGCDMSKLEGKSTS